MSELLLLQTAAVDVSVREWLNEGALLVMASLFVWLVKIVVGDMREALTTMTRSMEVMKDTLEVMKDTLSVMQESLRDIKDMLKRRD